jgi:hypothetical protein
MGAGCVLQYLQNKKFSATWAGVYGVWLAGYIRRALQEPTRLLSPVTKNYIIFT